MLTILDQKSYHLHFQKLGEIVRGWYDKKPNNKQVKQLLKCTSEVGEFTLQLIAERDMLKLINSQHIREKGELYSKYLKLKEELKKYEI